MSIFFREYFKKAQNFSSPYNWSVQQTMDKSGQETQTITSGSSK